MDNYKGFSLFNDIEDIDLRNRNRAVVLSNIASDHAKDRRISPSSAALIVNYFKHIPPEERRDVSNRFIKEMNLRGFELVGN